MSRGLLVLLLGQKHPDGSGAAFGIVHHDEAHLLIFVLPDQPYLCGGGHDVRNFDVYPFGVAGRVRPDNEFRLFVLPRVSPDVGVGGS